MASRTFTIFQDAPNAEAVRVKPVTTSIMKTRSSTRSNNITHGISNPNEPVPVDKENVNPATGERAGTSTSKKRKTNALSAKSTAPLSIKKVKSLKDVKDVESHSKKRKATSKVEKSKGTTKREDKGIGSSRKIKRVTRKVSKLPQLEEEIISKIQDNEHATQTSINSRCYELTVQPLADISQAYETADTTGDVLPSPSSKSKLRKDASAEPEFRDFFPSSQTFASLPSTSTARASSSEPIESRKFSTPERKQIYAAFTFSSPSPSSERFRFPLHSSSIPPTASKTSVNSSVLGSSCD